MHRNTPAGSRTPEASTLPKTGGICVCWPTSEALAEARHDLLAWLAARGLAQAIEVSDADERNAQVAISVRLRTELAERWAPGFDTLNLSVQLQLHTVRQRFAGGVWTWQAGFQGKRTACRHNWHTGAVSRVDACRYAGYPLPRTSRAKRGGNMRARPTDAGQWRREADR